MKLYSYFRSSAAYRVRIALNLKGIAYETIPVHLLKDGGQQLSSDYRDLNPTGLVPTLADEDWSVGQSMAILEYLEETHPEPALLPADAKERARVRAIAQFIACDIHPLNNLRVLKYLKHELGVDEDAKNAWYRHWVEDGMAALEAMLGHHPATGRYCHGDQPTFADLCLVPQVANARRMNCSLDAMPIIVRIDAACAELDAFQQAAPASQPDYEG
ncbi:maleylacetoacetate isomerase [Candidimonas sp. SYP-B2681]|uniref:maleylacetoacetate isomerase n=1 Tax=Candidimonas sp. SYP-B2681 TaxID=2497686 RepID=UPI000F89D18F|nr:maleylacetoacetate isomerase [Candidimonas sp. SYP-B2681]RTZ42561.1 maleylacetoacetate isomerase [Candidimonas sp. SYP-B2681]